MEVVKALTLQSICEKIANKTSVSNFTPLQRWTSKTYMLSNLRLKGLPFGRAQAFGVSKKYSEIQVTSQYFNWLRVNSYDVPVMYAWLPRNSHGILCNLMYSKKSLSLDGQYALLFFLKAQNEFPLFSTDRVFLSWK